MRGRSSAVLTSRAHESCCGSPRLESRIAAATKSGCDTLYVPLATVPAARTIVPASWTVQPVKDVAALVSLLFV